MTIRLKAGRTHGKAANIIKSYKVFDNPAEGRSAGRRPAAATPAKPNVAAKPLIYKIFENPAEGRPHYAAKPLIYKIFDSSAEGRLHYAAKPLIYTCEAVNI